MSYYKKIYSFFHKKNSFYAIIIIDKKEFSIKKIIRFLKNPRTYKGAGIALFQQKEGNTYVLLGKRQYNPQKGSWTFPGGGLEKNETLEECACREFDEETRSRFNAQSFKRISSFRIRLPYFIWLTLIVETDENIWDFPKGFSREFSELMWINIEKLKGLHLHSFVRTVIRKYRRISKKR